MMFRLTIAAVAVALALRPDLCRAEDVDLPIYVGRSVCVECHTSAERPCTLRPIPEHDRSFAALSRPEAKHIAALSGVIDPPTRSRICLSCHATAADEGPRWTAETFRIEDGVQCEACHECGSDHVAHYRLQSGLPSQSGSALAKQPQAALQSLPSAPAAKPTPPRGWLRRGSRWSCLPCHVEMPSHREVLQWGFRLDPEDDLYKSPINLAISPDGRRLYVVCEQSNSLIVVSPATGRILHEIPVGRRPQDVALAPDGAMLYVTNRMDASVSVIDTATARVVAEIPVGHEPHGILIDPSGRKAFVANTGADSVSVIDLTLAREERRVRAGRGPWSLALTGGGTTCSVTNIRPDLSKFRDPPRSEVTVIDIKSGLVTNRLVASGANMLQGIAAVRNNEVALFTMVRTKNLVPITRLAQGWVITNGLGIIWPDDGEPLRDGKPLASRIDQVLLDEPTAAFPDPMDIAVSPDGKHALVASGGSDTVAVVDVEKLLALVQSAPASQRVDVLPNHLGMSRKFVTRRVAVGRNPRSVLFSRDGSLAFVANALDDSVTVLDTSDYHTVRTIALGGPAGVTQIRRGAQLFHSADHTFGRQFSCRSCHPVGHTNGLTFDIEADGIGMNPVDNRTLRGIFDTPPFKWEGTNPTLERQCGSRTAMFFTRLHPFTFGELAALVRYLCTIEQPPNRFREPEGLTPAQRRGKIVFNQAAPGGDQNPLVNRRRCGSCHPGSHLTSRLTTDVASMMWFDAPSDMLLHESYLYDTFEFGELGSYYFLSTGIEPRRFDVPHLRNIYDSAPYLHNGGAATLEEIWTKFNMVDRHGRTGTLTRQQFNDLIAYVKAL